MTDPEGQCPGAAEARMRGSWETQGRTFRTAPPLAPWDRLLPGDWSRFLKGCRSPRRKHQTVTDIQNHLPGSPPGDDRNDDFAQAKVGPEVASRPDEDRAPADGLQLPECLTSTITEHTTLQLFTRG